MEGIRSDRGGVLGAHFATEDPSFGGVWGNAFLSVSAIMLFISCLEKIYQPLLVIKRWDGPYLMAGPVDFHPEGVFLIVGDVDRAGGDEETPSIVNISSETLLGIGIGGKSSRFDLRLAASERSLVDWVRTID